MPSLKHDALRFHKKRPAKLNVVSTVRLNTKRNLTLAYTPGVAYPCKVIAHNTKKVYDYTLKANTILVVSDGSAVLGLGNIGPEAALPVMEGKAALFKEFAGISAVPICLATQDVREIVETVVNIAPAYGGVNLEDISAPRCFEIEEQLKKRLDIPVIHDDQHGTATVVLAALINALKVVRKDVCDIRLVVNGIGAAGTAATKLLMKYGVQGKNSILCDRKGILHRGRKGIAKSEKANLAAATNTEKRTGTLADAIRGADVFLGVSAKNLLTPAMVKSMNDRAIVFAMANPDPEIMPDLARQAGAEVIATGRSDFPNQINNVLAFPGIFRGVLNARCRNITDTMLIAAAHAIAGRITKPTKNKILPSALDQSVAPAVARAVQKTVKK